jgi:hypothetical protein
MRRSRSRAGWLLVASVPAIGCTEILGVQDVPPPPDDGSLQAGADAGAGVDEGASADATAIDSNVDGAGADATTSDAPVDGTVSPPSAEAAVATPSADGAPLDAGMAEASPCGDTSSIPTNCGRCGHDCLGGQCSGGVCQPFALIAADAGVSPTDLAVDDAYLYWTDMYNGAVTRTDKSTGISTVLSTSTFFPQPIAVDDANVYWGDFAGLYWCPKSSCALNTNMAAGNYRHPLFSLALSDAGVFWSEGDPDLLWVPKAAVNMTPTVVWQGDAAAAFVAADGPRAYFTASDGLLHSVSADGGGAYAVAVPGAPAAAQSAGITLQVPDVYFTVVDPDAGLVASAAAASGDASALTASAVARGQHNPFIIVSDGTSLYWEATTSGGTASAIVTCTVGACVPRVVATTTIDLVTMAVDDNAIYWTLSGPTSITGSIWKLAK